MVKVKFWGVQGSCPGNQFENSLGSNTPCVSIEYNNSLLILDSGTGIRNLSNTLDYSEYDNVALLITHSHWDHIQGFPFFNFLHHNCPIYIYSHNNNHIQNMLNQINGENFPLDLTNIQADLIKVSNLKDLEKTLDIRIKTIPTNHHGDCIGYRLSNHDFDVCFLPDNQLHNPSQTSFQHFIEFCKNTDVLIHDAQYTENDMPKKENWGHSVINDTYKLATLSMSKKLVLFHHDPERKKDDIITITDDLNSRASSVETLASFEGLELVLLGK